MRSQDFAFDLDFNLADIPIIVQPENVQPETVYTEEDIINARSDGYSMGFSRGYEEGAVHGELTALTKSHEHQQDVIIKMYQDIEDILKKECIYDKTLTNMILNLSTTIIKKVLPHYTRKHGVDEMEHAIRYIMSTLIDQQDISVYLSPGSMEDIHERIADIKTCFSNKISFNNDTTLKEWECRVEWKGGGARWSQPDILNSIEELFTRFIQSTHSNKEARK